MELSTEKLTLETEVTLNNDVKMPIFGLGTWKLEKKEVIDPIKWALDAGYRHIDTAALYNNEKSVGKAIRESNIPRDDLFITSKVWDSDQGYKSTLKACEKSLKNLDIQYLDLYLIHWPRPKRNETWEALETLREEGKVRAIGVANFYIHHLEELMDKSDTIPAVNQFELNPFFYRKELIEYCQKKGIAVEAYSPLTHGKKLENNTLKQIADKYNKSSAQILIRWCLEHKFIVIPKSGSKNHIQENSDVFDFSLDGEDMKKLDNLDEQFRLLYDTSKWD